MCLLKGTRHKLLIIPELLSPVEYKQVYSIRNDQADKDPQYNSQYCYVQVVADKECKGSDSSSNNKIQKHSSDVYPWGFLEEMLENNTIAPRDRDQECQYCRDNDAIYADYVNEDKI